MPALPARLFRPRWVLLATVLAFATGPLALAQPELEGFTPVQLDELVAPVALYPDVVLDSLLPATTVPDHVAAAAQFVRAQGGAALAVPRGTGWDPSVLALLQYPDVLRWLDENRSWTEQMGWAMTVQPNDVLEAVQRFRFRARELGVLASNQWQRVVVFGEPTYIVIEPAVPEIVYVPVYEPWPLLQPGFVFGASASFYHSWWSFSFGAYGPWSWHEIRWPYAWRGVYAHSHPWWWNRWRGTASDWGPARPSQWTSRRSVIRTESRPRDAVVRPRLAVDDGTVARRDGRTADVRVRRRSADLVPPEIRTDVRRRVSEAEGTPSRTTTTTRIPEVATPPTPVPEPRTTPPRAPDRVRDRTDVPDAPPLPTPRARTDPPRARDRVPAPDATPRARTDPPRAQPDPPRAQPDADAARRRVRTPPPRRGATVFDQSTIDRLSRRGRASLEREERTRTTPAPKPNPRAAKKPEPEPEPKPAPPPRERRDRERDRDPE